MVGVINWCQTNSSAVQLLVSILTLVVTTIYVVLTNRILHAPFIPVLIPLSVSHNTANDTYTIKVKNYGPGIAIRAKCKALIKHKYKFLNGLHFSEYVYSLHEDEVEVGKEIVFVFNKQVDYNCPFYIYWQASTGKKNKSVWLLDIRNHFLYTELLPLNRIERTKYRLVWFYREIVSCYYKLKLHIDKNEKEKQETNYQKILGLLYGKGTVDSCDITDEIGGDDEITTEILFSMKKARLIDFDGDYAKIRPKGKKMFSKVNKNNKQQEIQS